MPEVADLPDLRGRVRRPSPTPSDAEGKPVFHPYLRDPETLARPWAIPGTPGLEHRIGGIEKADVTGDISYDPDNHDLMVAAARRPRSTASPRRSADLEVDDPTRRRRRARARLGLDLRPDRRRDPAGPRRRRPRSPGPTCATSTRSRPTPARCCARYRRVLVPEMNLGQLALLLRAKYLVDVQSATPRCAGCRSRATELADVDRAVRLEADAAERRRPRSEPPMSTVDLGMPLTRHRRRARASPTDAPRADQEGVHLRPGGALVPGLRRLRDPRRRAGLPARARAQAREHRLRLRHRLLVALPVLPRHLRHALDPRPRAGHRDRAGRPRAATCRCGSSPATATRSRSAATT